MTYCKAWKKGKSIYMIADSATSSISDEVKTNINTFGEIQGLYGNYYVQEGTLKIYTISENIVLSFSGVTHLANDIIENIYDIAELMDVKDWMKVICDTYGGVNIEIIIAVSDESCGNTVYYFNGSTFKEVESCEIGNGKDLSCFSNDVNSIVDHFSNGSNDDSDYLAMVLGVIQCYIIKNNTFTNGVGGTLSGLILNSKIKWFRDLEYYIFDDDIRNGSTMSVISRGSSIFSSSDLDGVTRFMLNPFTDKILWNDLYYRNGIVKSLNTKNAYYYFFYNNKYNVIAFLKANGQTQNIYFKRWIRRDKEKTDYAYSFNPDFESLFAQFDSSVERIPSLIVLKNIKNRYMSHDEVNLLCDPDDIKRVNNEKNMDFDFNEFEFKNYDKSKLRDVKKTIDKYHNLVLIDFSYFCDAINEKITLIKSVRECSSEQLNLAAIVDVFLKQMVPDEFIKYRVIVLKDNKDNRIISGCDMKEYFLKYSNCIVIDSNDFNYDLCGTLYQLMHNFYLNDAFFHLDKFIVVSDNIDINSLLIRITPEFNFTNNNPDIILVRNMNSLTNMDGRFRYIVIDYLVITMLGMSMDEFGKIEMEIEGF